MKKKLLAGILVFAFMTTMAFAGPTMAYIPPSTANATAVAVVPGFNGGPYGSLAHTDSAFDPFNFTIVPWADVTAANLAQYQIVVLHIYTGSVNLNSSQKDDLNAWIFNGGKLIIYDSEQSAIDYSWLVFPFSTVNPGQMGASGTIVYKEENVLGSTNPANTASYIDTANLASGTDAVGDSNVVVTQDPHWCGDMKVINALAAENWTRMYAEDGDGMLIYNGLDLDYCGEGTAPGATGGGALARLFLLELQCPWGADYVLPCGTPVTGGGEPVGGIVINPALMQPVAMALAIALIAAGLVVFVTLYRKNSLHAIQ